MKLAPNKGGPRVNEGIDTPKIQLIDSTGDNVGVVEIEDALARAVEAGLDLVEISPNSEPPVCKILDFGKYKYQAQKKAAEARTSSFISNEASRFVNQIMRRMQRRWGVFDAPVPGSCTGTGRPLPRPFSPAETLPCPLQL